MALARYLDKRKMEFLRKKIELLIKVQLKITPNWLIYKNQFKEKQELRNCRDSFIVIIIANNSDTTYLYTKKLKFGRMLKVVERY